MQTSSVTQWLSGLKKIQSKLMIIVSIILIISSTLSSSIIFKFLGNELFKGRLKNFQSETRGISTTIENLLDKELAELNQFIYDDDFIDFTNVDTESLKNANSDSSQTQRKLNTLLKEYSNNDSLETVYFLNKDGLIIAASDDKALFTDVSSREYFTTINNGEKSYISNIIKSNETGNYINVLSRGLYDDNGNLIGVIWKDIVSNIYTSILSGYNHDRFNVSLTDKEGSIIYDKDKNLIGNLTEIDNSSNEKFDETKTIYYSHNEEPKVAMCNKIKNSDWTVYSSAYISDIKGPIKKAAKWVTLLSVLILMVMLTITKFLAKKFSVPIQNLTKHMEIVSKGNLSLEIKGIDTGDEIEELAYSINTTIKNLSSMLKEIKGSIHTVNYNSQNLAAINEEVSASNSEITQAVSGIAEKICTVAEKSQECENITKNLDLAINDLKSNNIDMNTQSNEVINSIEQSSDKINSLIKSKLDSVESFNELKDTIEGLFSGINNISNFLNVISNIAEQTNLLSLNAAIEAARAGEAGLGFSVVAEQIRSLSHETQTATKSINSIIKNIDSLVLNTKSTLHNTEKINVEEKQAFENMNNAFNDMQEILNKMVLTSSEIYKNINIVSNEKGHVLDAIIDVANSSEQIAAISEEVNASVIEQANTFQTVNHSAEELKNMAETLNNEVDVFIV